MINFGEPSANVMVKFLQSRNDDPVIAHSRHDLGHGMGVIGECLRFIALLRHVVHTAVAFPLMLEVGIMALLFVLRRVRLVPLRCEHVCAGVLFIDHNDGARLHALCYDGKEPIQILKPAERTDGDDHNIELFLMAVVNVIDIDSLKFAREI